MDRDRQGPHRDDVPAWGWVGLLAARVTSLVVAAVPVALLVWAVWWWTHGGAQRAPGLVRQTAANVQAWIDSAWAN